MMMTFERLKRETGKITNFLVLDSLFFKILNNVLIEKIFF